VTRATPQRAPPLAVSEAGDNGMGAGAGMMGRGVGGVMQRLLGRYLSDRPEEVAAAYFTSRPIPPGPEGVAPESWSFVGSRTMGFAYNAIDRWRVSRAALAVRGE
jgi:hypothetical protein